ncbi:GNAT family N-acetyltransferase [Clostridium beijerinckii]|uniref:GNAT family N-acetyltransferase n=1 Tax=Clostridium beijerinckii TaxID=1520 RepID=A0A7X9SKK7_CLOBE|nr:GNAT family N-acetyltransferase [Clostridium beijerinckii]NMF03283.1 GNAT family N-acetyltransferase [Clostridium beijerinckii]
MMVDGECDILEIALDRASKEDYDLLFNWVNDEEVRKNSFNPEKILYSNHIKWFNNMINSDKCIIFILKLKNTPVGQVRIAIERNFAIISYSLDKSYRGKGLTTTMLSLLEKEVKNNRININKLIAFVKLENIASQKVFEKLKYNKKFHNEFLEYEKYLNN